MNLEDHKDIPVDAETPLEPSKKTESSIIKARQVSVSEYMYKNIHLLGFENVGRVINVAIRELMDNSLDAANQKYICPKINCIITPKNKNYQVFFQDYGPGIPVKQVGNICGKLLYGSKFIENKPQRGAQGMGLTALILYAQKTTGIPVRIITKTIEDKVPTQVILKIDVKNNKPIIVSSKKLNLDNPYYGENETGFLIELNLKAQFQKNGPRSSLELLKQYTYLNPTLELYFKGPDNEVHHFNRLTEQIVKTGKSIKNVPHHVPFGDLQKCLESDQSIIKILTDHFEGPYNLHEKTLKDLKIPLNLKGKVLSLGRTEDLWEKFKENFEGIRPEEDCLIDLGERIILAVTKNHTREFDNVLTQKSKPIYYQNGVLKIEISIFYGGDTLSADQKIEVYRVANGTPLTYQSSACAITKTLMDYNWKKLGLTHVENELPRGKMIIFVHVNSTKVPYITESKDAIANIVQIRQAITQTLDAVSKKLSGYMKREEAHKSLIVKTKIISEILPDLVSTLERGLECEKIIDEQGLRVLKSKILEMICIHKLKNQLHIYNYSDSKKQFVLNGQDMDLDVKKKCVVPFEKEINIKGLLPVEYIVI